jgi:hypothetical protein
MRRMGRGEKEKGNSKRRRGEEHRNPRWQIVEETLSQSTSGCSAMRLSQN